MASVLTNTVCILLLLLITTNSIHGYRLQQELETNDQSIENDDLPSNERINLRSVLWPKICFTTVVKKSPNNQDQQQGSNRHLSKRNARKCYPFDTV